MNREIAGVKFITTNIHPIWAIEEYARIFRNCVWFRPPHPPNNVESSAELMINGWLIVGEICIRIDNGAIFCHVSKIIPDIKDVPCVTSVTQKWNGAKPSFVIKDNVKASEIIGLLEWMIDHCPEYIIVVIIDISRIMDAVACVRKYFVAASVDRGLVLSMRIGIIDIMLSSSPIHINSQWELIRVINVPVMRVV